MLLQLSVGQVGLHNTTAIVSSLRGNAVTAGL